MAQGRLARWFGFATAPMPAREAYGLWADTYPPWPHNPLMQAEQAVVAPLIAATSPSTALDVGTGTGRYLPHLRDSGARLVVGVDLSLAMLGRHTQDARRICADACRLPFADASFDLVLSSLMVGDIEQLSHWTCEAARVLAPGGHLIYSDFHPAWSIEGWRRTFRTRTGQLVELEYFPHAIDEHLIALKRASLGVRTIREPRLAGRKAPVVVALHAVKAGLRQMWRR
jgi:SAM-dependent methyltransferase